MEIVSCGVFQIFFCVCGYEIIEEQDVDTGNDSSIGERYKKDGSDEHYLHYPLVSIPKKYCHYRYKKRTISYEHEQRFCVYDIRQC